MLSDQAPRDKIPELVLLSGEPTHQIAEKAKQFALKRAVHVIGGPGTEMASIIVVVADIDAQGTPVPIPAKTKMFKIDVSHHT